jgi:hypothetical protein
MWQEIVVYIVLFLVIVYTGYKIYGFFTKKNTSGCCGCSGCDIKETMNHSHNNCKDSCQ